MNANKILLSGLIGGVAAFFLGFLFYGLLFSSFFEANSGSATGVMRGDDEILWIPMVIGHLAWGLFFAVIFGRWAGIRTFSTGVQAGALMGFLIALAFDMIQLGSSHTINTTGAVADIVVLTIISGLIGGVVGWFLGRNEAKA